MAIEIIDGFKVSSAVPVDNRIVASGSNARNAIAYKYNGLRVYDTLDSIPYVWLDNTWKKENDSALGVPAIITPGYSLTSTYRVGQLLKVYNEQKLLTNSNMFEVEWLSITGAITSRTIAINHTSGGVNTPGSVSSTAKFDVNGTIKATSFEGSGANITNIDPNNFNTSTNKIKIDYIERGTAGYVLRTNNTGNGLEWISLASSFAPQSITPTLETVGTSIHYLTFVASISGSSPLLVYNTSNTGGDKVFGVIPGTGQIVVKNDNTPATPAYSFRNETTSGIYRSAAGSLAISILSSKKLEVDTNGLKVFKGDASNPGISFIGANNYGIYQTTTGNNRIGVVVAGNEMMRIRSSSTQGNGNTTFYGDGAVLSVQGNTHAFIEFYRQGSSTPNTSASRSAWIGYPSSSSQDFSVTNETKVTSFSLLSNGTVDITSRSNNAYGIYMGNKGVSPVDRGYGVLMYGTFQTTQLQTAHNGVIARFDANGSGTPYTSVYVTTQGIVIWGHPTGSGTQPLYSGSEAVPSLTFNRNGSTGLYSDAINTLGITTNGTKKMVINSTGVQMSAFESQALAVPTVSGISNASSSNNAFNGSNSACINAVYKTTSSNSGTYTARYIRLGFKFNAYTGSSKSSQVVVFAADTCDRMFYCGAGGNTVANFRGYESKFYIGGPSNNNYLGRFLSSSGASENIYNGAGSFYVPANHIFSIVFEWYSNGSAVNDTSTEGGFGMEVRAFRMGLS